VTGFSLKSRLLVGMVIMLLPLMAVLLVSMLAFNEVLSTLEEVAEESIEEIGPVADLEDLLEDLEVQLHAAFEHPERFDAVAFDELIPLVERTYQRTLELPFAQKTEQGAVARSWANWNRIAANWTTTAPSLAVQRLNGVQRAQSAGYLSEAIVTLERMRSVSLAEIEADRTQERHWRQNLNLFLPLVLSFGTIIAVLIGIGLAKSILTPVRELEAAARHLADGQLSHRVSALARDELGDLARAFNLMAQRLEQNHQTLENLSSIDYLTGVANVREFYRLFHEETRRAQRYGHEYSLLIIDIDYFKKVNDSYGHQVGDLVLQDFGGRLLELVRTSDHVARIGGDEFAVILTETSAEAAWELGGRIHQFFNRYQVKHPGLEGRQIVLSVSIGLASYPGDARKANDLFSAADQALYSAKHEGRNRICRVTA